MISYLQVDELTKSFGNRILFEDISFGVAKGEHIGIIAQNGNGKTTLLNIIAGKEDYDSGRITFHNDIKVGYLMQNPSFSPELTILQACFDSPNETVQAISRYEKALYENEPQALHDAIEEMDRLKAWEYEHRVKGILSKLNIKNFEQPVKELSGGQIKRIALANILITDPDMLILDEPTNHLDIEMTEWLEEDLLPRQNTLLMVPPHRYFFDRRGTPILEKKKPTL